MTTSQDSIKVRSCQYTPIYLIQNPGAIQERPVAELIVTQNHEEETKPVSDNLKRFYESSGLLENNVINNVTNITKPRILKKSGGKVIRNNIKVANIMLPKVTNTQNEYITVNNVVLKTAPTPPAVAVSLPVATPVSRSVATPVSRSVATPVSRSVAAPVSRPMATPAPLFVPTPVSHSLAAPTALHVPIPASRSLCIPASVPVSSSAPPPATVPVINLTVPRVDSDRKIVKLKNVIKTKIKNVHKVKSTEKILQIYPQRVVESESNNVPLAMPKAQPKEKLVQSSIYTQQIVQAAEHMLPNTQPKENYVQSIIHQQRVVETTEPTLPKARPNDNTSSPKQTKHTSVQLLKLGETYHSLNELNADQMKIVNQALKVFKKPVNSCEPTYDPVTNTRFIYKFVSPKDLTVVGKNKTHHKKTKKVEVEEEEEIPEEQSPEEVTVTRSGRKVKLPKQKMHEYSQQKSKKKWGNIVTCYQCSTEFSSLYRLQKHYESNPTHTPAKSHWNLFHCLLAIVKSGPEEDRANMFIEQLEQLIEKLKSLLPCLLKKIDDSEATPCNINDNIGRLFGMSPGKYNLNMNALSCVKDVDGHCCHNPAPKPKVTDTTQNNDEVINGNENEDCARINAADKWPTANKRLWKIKKKNSENAKRMRMASDNAENNIMASDNIDNNFIELDVEDLITFTDTNEKTNELTDTSAINKNNPSKTEESVPIIPTDVVNNDMVDKKPLDQVEDNKQTKIPYLQFHSTHFDIRSSPVKPSAAVFCKFQIDSEKIARYEAQLIRPLDFDKDRTKVPEDITTKTEPAQTELIQSDTIESDVDSVDIQNILRDEIMNLSYKEDISHDLSFDATKDFFINTDNDKSDNFVKSNDLIDPSSIHSKLPLSNEIDHVLDSDSDSRLLSQGHTVLNFLESLGNDCLSYSETDNRNTNIDFQLDLFSFQNT